MMRIPDPLSRLSGRLRLERLSARARSRLQRAALAAAFGPLVVWAAAGAALALSGYHVRPELAALASLFFYAGLVILGWRALRSYRPAGPEAGRRAVDALMEGEPASAQHDRPIPATPASLDLWNIHIARLAASAVSLTTPGAAHLWRRIDPFFLRWIVPALVAIAAIVAGADGPRRLIGAATPDIGAFFGAHGMTMQAWILPPAYTGLAPFSVAEDQSVAVPDGSTAHVRIQGSQRPRLRLVSETGTITLTPEKGADGVYEFRLEIAGSTTAEILLWGVRKRFSLSRIADTAPSVFFSALPETGEDNRLVFGWSAHDDYGIEAAFFSIQLVDPDQPHSDELVEIPLAMSRVDPVSISDEAMLDLTKHRWAGLKVQGRVTVADAHGQTGHSAAAFFTLPEKLFLEPLALASVEIRSTIMREKEDYLPASAAIASSASGASGGDETFSPDRVNRLELAPAGIRRSATLLDAITHRPDGFIRDRAIFLGLRHARWLLDSADSLDQTRRAEEILWRVALRAELGNLADAARALKLARDELEKALRDGAGDDEVSQRIDALRSAIDKYIEALIARAIEKGDFDEGGGGSAEFNSDDFEEMLRALEDMAETGARDQARQLLSDMSRLLENMRNLRLREGGNGDGPGMAGGDSDTDPSETDQQVEALADLLRDQRELNDETYQMDRSRQGQEQGTAPGGGEQEEKDIGNLAERQEELRRRLQRLADKGPGEVEDRLDDALRGQKRAGSALSDGRTDQALAPQGEVGRALREAITELAELADRERAESAENDGGRDPLDRPSGGGQNDRVVIPDEVERQRARDILDELRRRSTNPKANEEERDYLERLLRRF